MRFFVFTVIFTLCVWPKVWANTASIDSIYTYAFETKTFDRINIGKELQVYIDQTKALTIDDFLTNSYQ